MAAALTLGLRGHHVIILESAPKVHRFPCIWSVIKDADTFKQLMEVGAGIQVSPNMLKLFDRE